MRPRRPALWLALAAPLIAEFVAANLPIAFLWLLIFYVPLYGGAAVLIRELGRRSARPWPVIVVLGLAYGLLEEAFVSFSLFNPDYADLRLLDFGWIDALDMGAWWTVFVLVLHTVWSILVPIVLIESLTGDERADRPWLSRRALWWPAGALVFGAAAASSITLAEDDFVPSSGQVVGAALVLLALLGFAAALSRPGSTPSEPTDRSAPRPLVLGTVAAGGALVFVAGAAQAGPPALTLVAYAVVGSVLVVQVARWSRRGDWSRRHELALASGALGVHVAFALLQAPLVDVPTWVAVGGDVVFALGTAVVVTCAWRRVARPVGAVDGG